MYYRIYPSKNNTIFKNNSGTLLMKSGDINTGQNPVLELRDGNSESKIVLDFDLTHIKDLLNKYSFSCNIKIFDAGVLYEPVLKDLKTIDLFYFTKDFVEGDGFSFVEGDAKTGVSNWNKRTLTEDWSDCFTLGILNAFQLNTANDDIIIKDLEPFIIDALQNNKNPKFALSLSSNTISTEIYTKFLYGRKTRTIFTPYLEFFIGNEVIDGRRNTIATKETTLYLINQLAEDFQGTLTCKIIDKSNNIISNPTVTNLDNGIYQIKFTPDITHSNELLKDIWSIGSEEVFIGMLEVKSPNKLIEENYSNMYFYPSTQYTHPLIRQGDKVKVELIAEQRGKGSKLVPFYEFKVIASNGFEMQPWTAVNLYRDKLYFTIDTTYYFPELEYEIFARLKTHDFTKVGLNSYKFRLVGDGPTYLADRATNPYNSRDYMSK